MAIFRPGKRRQYIIDKKFQFRYMVTWLVITALFITVIVGGMSLGLSIIQRSVTYGRAELAFILKADAIFIILVTMVLAIYLLLLSHRIAGPAYRLEKSLDRMIQGDLSFTVALRKNDYLKHVANRFNDLITVLKNKQGNLQTVAKDTKILKELIQKNHIPQEAIEIITRIDNTVSALLATPKE